MCGIFFRVVRDVEDSTCDKVQLQRIRDALRCRGPDCANTITIELNNVGKLTFFSTVLSMRDPLTVQPLQSVDTTNILQFNGEIYDVAGDLKEYGNNLLLDEAELDNDQIGPGRNDTSLVMHLFERFGVQMTIQCLRGEYAFVYFDRANQTVWWARDCIGRRSLLVNSSVPGEFSLSSVPSFDHEKRKNWVEVKGGSLFKLDLSQMNLETEIPWTVDENTSNLTYPYSTISHTAFDEYKPEQFYLSEFESILREAVQRRVLAITHAAHSNYAILFSGGIDCTVLAYHLITILHDHSLTIDFLNVAFENPRTGGGYNTPDRLLGRRSFEELSKAPGCVNAKCKLNFVEINIPFHEAQEYKAQVIDLMYPKQSVMDYSIALAFFFAARGVGHITLSFESGQLSQKAEEYSTPSRILISGLGADELYAGYSRHSAGFRRGGYDTLAEELALDFGRLHERNLGRDDRVGANWGKEVSFY